MAIVKTNSTTYKEEYLFDKDNDIYRGVEKLFLSLDMDKGNYDSPHWNPFGHLVKPGQHVVIKPNFVTIRDREKVLRGEYLSCSSTHPAVLRPIIDYCWKALGGEGKISIVDSPIEGSDFEKTVNDLGMYRLLDFLINKKEINLELLDLRDFTFTRRMLFDNLIVGNHSLNIGLLIKKTIAGDPRGYTVVDLKDKSNFAKNFSNYPGLRFHRSNKKNPVAYHSRTKNLYSISNTVLNADLFINVPKLKAHKKTGVTLSLKSLIGISNRKYWIPHYQEGCPPQGDEYPRKPCWGERAISSLSRYPLPGGNSLIINIPKVSQRKNIVTEGCWSGNNTLWMSILDLNSILFYADKKGMLKKNKQRNYITIIDGVIGGEGEGPLAASPKKCGILIGGYDPVAVDCIATSVMGFAVDKINHIKNADQNEFSLGISDINQIKIVAEESGRPKFDFKPPKSWENALTEKKE